MNNKAKLTKKMQDAITRFGIEKCIEAFDAYIAGNGANTVYWTVLTSLTDKASDREATMWGNRAIDAGRFLAETGEGSKPKAGYHVVTVWGDVEPSLSEAFDTEQERDEEAKRIRKNDTEDNEEGYSGIYWLNNVDGKLDIGSYSGIFFEDAEEGGQV